MNLEKLTLRNFQAHEKLVIEFDPNITTIVGASDVGKSAIIRALSWVLYNQPSGEAFIKHGEERVRTRLTLDDGVVITRERGKENLYKLDEQEFKAFGSNVPDAIRDLLKVSEINIQRQFDAPFWFAESNGEVSRRLNEIVNLGIIDDALASVAAQLRKANERVEFSKERVSELEEKARSFAFVEAFSAQVSLCASLQKEVREMQAKRARLLVLGNQAADYRKIVREINEFILSADASILYGDMLEQKSLKVRYLSNWIPLAEDQLRKSTFKAPDLTKLERESSLAQSIEKDKQLLQKLMSDTLNWKIKLKNLQSEVVTAIDNLKKQFKNCPLCNKPLFNED